MRHLPLSLHMKRRGKEAKAAEAGRPAWARASQASTRAAAGASRPRCSSGSSTPPLPSPPSTAPLASIARATCTSPTCRALEPSQPTPAKNTLTGTASTRHPGYREHTASVARELLMFLITRPRAPAVPSM